MSASVEIGVLGSLVVCRDGTVVEVAAPKQRALLALLALEAPRAVSTDSLVDQLWEGEAPRSASTAVQVYVSQLRKALGKVAIATRPPGYALDVAVGGVDALAFEQLAAEGRSLVRSGEVEAAARVLNQALGLWRGQALAEFVYQGWAAGPAERLEELRVVAREDLVDARLGFGEAREMVAELEALVAAFPLRERLRGQLMLALYRAGRQADALAVYQDARRVLVDELGIDPSPGLAELERRILQQDPELGSTSMPLTAVISDTESDQARAARVDGSAGGGTQLSSAKADAPRRERKVVTILFCDLVEFTAAAEASDPEDVDVILGRYYAMARGEVERFGGTIEKFIGDAVMAVFGAPVAREDDPERAVRAALAIIERAASLRQEDATAHLEVRLGVTTGEALVKVDADTARGEAMVSGDVVNTAARLQAAAPIGGVLVDALTMRATAHAIQYGRNDPLVVKGKREPVSVWLALEALAVSGETNDSSVPLVGRAYELGALLNAFARTCEDESVQLLSLVGVPGIGKSRLVAELRQHVDTEPGLVTWLEGRSLAYGEGLALWALGEIVKGRCGVSEADPAKVAAEKVEATVTQLIDDPADAAWVAGQLAFLVGAEVAGATSGVTDRGEAFAAWQRFAESIADQGPTVMVFEDLHWADDALLDFIDLLADRASSVPLLVVCTARPELLQRRASWGGGKQNATTLSLAPLADQETGQLVTEFLGEDDALGEMKSRVIAQSEGNPLFIREYVRMLRDERASDSASAGSGSLPISIQGLIAARLDALSSEEKQVAQVASVIGRVSWIGAISHLRGTSPAGLDEILHRLERRQLFRRNRHTTIPGHVEVTFTHALIQDVTYHQIPRAERASYHRAAAEWIEGVSGERDDRLELLAHHLGAAASLDCQTGNEDARFAERASRALKSAGDRAASLGAYSAAANHYAAALALATEEDDLATGLLLLDRGKVLFQIAETFPNELQRATEMLSRLGDTTHAAEAEAYRAAWLVNHNQAVESYEHIKHACELLRDEPDSPEKAFAVVGRGRIGSELGDRDCWDHIVEGRAMAQRLGIPDLEARTLFVIGEERLFRDDPEGLVDIEASLAVARTLRSGHAVLCKLCIHGDYLALGRISEARELHLEAMLQARDLGLRTYQDVLHAQFARLSFVLGDFDAARVTVEEALSSLTAGGDVERSGTLVLGDEATVAIRAVMNLADGRPKEAKRDARLSLQVAPAGSTSMALPLALASFVHWSLGDPTAAEGTADEWFAMVEAERIFLTGFAWPFLAQSLRSLHREQDLLAAIARIRVTTPWVESARLIATDRFDDAAKLLVSIGVSDAFVALVGLSAEHGAHRTT